MSGRNIPHPYNIPREGHALWRLLTPASVGAVSAVSFALSSRLSGRLVGLGDVLPRVPRVASVVPIPLYMVLFGFAFGFGTVKCMSWFRWNLLRMLFSYQGWIVNNKSLKTKAWGMLVRMLEGPGPHSTYTFQKLMPKQPLPDLDATLDRWIVVTKQWITKDEHEVTRQAVQEFRRNEGPQIQEYLEKRARDNVNWVSEYWMMAAYLSSRESIAINSNYQMSCAILPERCTNQLARTANIVHRFAKFEAFLTKRQVEQSMLDVVPICMNGFQYLFNTTRIPGEHIDTIQRYPGERHIIVMRNGHFFKINMYLEDSHGKSTVLSVGELKKMFKDLCEYSDSQVTGPSVAALTSQNRTVWAKQRLQLAEQNAETLKAIETSMFMVSLDPKDPKSYHEFTKFNLCGNGYDRWFDKGFTTITFANAWSGNNVEHSVLDATVFSYLYEYAVVNEEYEDNDIASRENYHCRTLPNPQTLRLQWNLSGMEESVEKATVAYKNMMDDLDMHVLNCSYGKGVMKKAKLSPDGYFQMAMALAMKRMHNVIPKTYEPSFGRLFALGRTETVHPLSDHSVMWVKAMDDPTKSREEKVDLIRRAIKYQSQYRLDATMGKGCDRHLLALFCASRELGMDIPKIFMDKPWQMPFQLSTSQTPTKIFEMVPKGTLDFDGVTGGFGPGCHDGYGCCYAFMGDEFAHVVITSWKSSTETNSSQKFAEEIAKALQDMKQLMLGSEVPPVS